jgi:hypothetical protein
MHRTLFTIIRSAFSTIEINYKSHSKSWATLAFFLIRRKNYSSIDYWKKKQHNSLDSNIQFNCHIEPWPSKSFKAKGHIWTFELISFVRCVYLSRTVVVATALKLQYAWKDFNFSFIYEITINVWCIGNKTRVRTTKVNVSVGVQTLSFFMLYKYKRWWSCPLWNFSMNGRIVIFLSHMNSPWCMVCREQDLGFY